MIGFVAGGVHFTKSFFPRSYISRCKEYSFYRKNLLESAPLSRNSIGECDARISPKASLSEGIVHQNENSEDCLRSGPERERSMGYDDGIANNFGDSNAFTGQADFAGESQPERKDARKTRKRKLPVVAIIGRPNVGKSTLFNRLAGHFHDGAIIENTPGITRDRTYRSSFWNGYDFLMVDTGGLVFDDDSTYLPEIRAQALLALQEASAAVMCVDARAGLTSLDEEIALFLRRECKVPVLVAANKAETDLVYAQAAEFWKLGFENIFPVSAMSGSGTAELLDELVTHIPLVTDPEEDNSVIKVAIVGRPNVGKSSLLNVLTLKERAIVSEVPGTTRDAVDETIVRGDSVYCLIDTAGIRRKQSVDYGTEFFMVNRAFKAIRRADVVLLVVDLVARATEQDRKIAEIIEAEGKACVIVANKWDLIEGKDNKSYKKYYDDVRERLATISWAKAELVSALTRQRTSKLFDFIDEAVEQHRRRVSTATVNEVLREALEWHKPPTSRQAKQGRVYYCTQVATAPPTVVMFVNSPRLFSAPYRRYMERQFREALGFEGSPLRILYRGKSKPPTF